MSSAASPFAILGFMLLVAVALYIVVTIDHDARRRKP